MEILSKCPVCGGDEGISVLEFKNRKKYIVCRCGCAYLNPRKTDAEISEYYSSGEYRKMTEEFIEDKSEVEHQERRAEIVSGMVDKFDIMSHLDIGCSTGTLLRRVEEGKGRGFVSAGVDPDPKWTKDVKVLYRSLEEVKGKYDLITMIHVLEHMNRPREVLEKVSKLLSPGGVLVIEVPNRRAYMVAFNSPQHVVAFDLASLGKLVMSTGYEILAHLLHGWLMNLPLDLYITIIATNDKAKCQDRYNE
jgi:SAM-dependent methyltransferase